MKIYYNEKMSVKTKSESNSSHKPKLFIEQVKDSRDVSVVSDFSPILQEDLLLAHDPLYIEDIFKGERPNGFWNVDIGVAKSTLWTIGSLYEASSEALRENEIVCSPTSGFHHAHYAEAAGYCTFNGLVVVAQMLLRSKKVKKVAILDCDHHYGDGTDNILDELKLKNISNYTLGKKYKKGSSGKEYLDELRCICGKINQKYDLLIYQAGADLHIEDPLGGVLTRDELKVRDRIVFETVGTPIVWNLAGGYHHEYQRTLDLHVDTLEIAINAQKNRLLKSA